MPFPTSPSGRSEKNLGQFLDDRLTASIEHERERYRQLFIAARGNTPSNRKKAEFMCSDFGRTWPLMKQYRYFTGLVNVYVLALAQPEAPPAKAALRIHAN